MARKSGRAPRRSKTRAISRRASARQLHREARPVLRREAPPAGNRGYGRVGAASRGRMSKDVPFPIPAGWKVDPRQSALEISFTTKDFVDAVELMQAIADVAEDLEHHPDVHLTEYNHLRIVTYSHDVGHLTERDERLAERLTKLFQTQGILDARGVPVATR
ncbi:MAG: 4a-hydroxytetrahydrobiopterin dehydratase [Thermoplasmatota archaeon]